MSEKKVIKPVALAVGAALAGSLAISGAVNADEGGLDSPFKISNLEIGYMLGEGKDKDKGEGSCGEDKEGGEGSCGEDKEGEGSCGEDKEGEGSCGEDKEGEGSCGEGSCGGSV